MNINDVIHGDCIITEPVLVELCSSASVQRLKRIAQSPLPAEFSPTGYCGTRFEHCLGVMLLLRTLGASLEEQMSGLLHDVSHTAFSHLVDWVIGDPAKEDFQDSIHEQMIMRSELPSILEKHGYDARRISNHSLFHLLEQPMPALCADRIDYSLRCAFHYWKKTDVIQQCISDLQLHDGRIVLGSRPSAELFAQTYLRCYNEYWSAPEKLVRQYILSEALRTALKNKIICHDDFFTTDGEVIKKLRSSNHPDINKAFALLGLNAIPFAFHPEGVRLVTKFRYVNPEFLDNGTTRKIMDVNPEYKRAVEESRARTCGGVHIKLVD